MHGEKLLLPAYGTRAGGAIVTEALTKEAQPAVGVIDAQGQEQNPGSRVRGEEQSLGGEGV
jgi:hypothetical protein